NDGAGRACLRFCLFAYIARMHRVAGTQQRAGHAHAHGADANDTHYGRVRHNPFSSRERRGRIFHPMPTSSTMEQDWHQHIADSHLKAQLKSDAELDHSVVATLARRRRDGDVWLFGYGSLLWHPQVAHEETRKG